MIVIKFMPNACQIKDKELIWGVYTAGSHRSVESRERERRKEEKQ